MLLLQNAFIAVKAFRKFIKNLLLQLLKNTLTLFAFFTKF